MPNMPAICNNCGTIFPSGFFGNNAQMTFSGCQAGPCPRCNGIGNVPDGTFSFVENAIQILSAPQRTIEELTRFSEILRSAQKGSTSAEKIKEEVLKETPQLSPLLRFLKNEDFRFWLTTIIAVLALVIPMFEDEDPKPEPVISQEIEVNQVINNVYEIDSQNPLINTQAAPPTQTITQPIRSEKIGRNKPCPCGSEMKYKYCHGR
ncbi:SEC-C metal-binding domain-containing protein [Priestia flexa]|uniref:SEC-C metal-binding domain-containing protein n=1 Tax=Priestia flexa TaxID=86664 RepID=UPI003D2DB583